MAASNIEERVKETISENLGVNKETITRETSFIEDIGAGRSGFLDRYEGEVKPFLEPFDALSGSTVIGGSNPDKATFLLTVK